MQKRFFLLPATALPVAFLLGAFSVEPPAADCTRDYTIPIRADSSELWSTQGGRVTLHQSSAGNFVRFQFRPNPQEIRFDHDAALRIRTSFACTPGESPMAFEADMRVSHVLRDGAELQDVMLLGNESRYLPGAGVVTAETWARIRIPIPQDAPVFQALHLGFGSAWVREYAEITVAVDFRNMKLMRRRFLVPEPRIEPSVSWRSPDAPEQADLRAKLLIARGAPVLAVLDVPATESGRLNLKLPSGVSAEIWEAGWHLTEQKLGVVQWQAIRLLPYHGEWISASAHPHRFWIRLATDGVKTESTEWVARWNGRTLKREIELIAVTIPVSTTAFQMYYQINTSWPAYGGHPRFYQDTPAHFAQLKSLGFTGVQLAAEPHFINPIVPQADFNQVGGYWQAWPHSLGDLLSAWKGAGFQAPLVWEGLRIFTRDEAWTLVKPRSCEPTMPASERIVKLAKASVPGMPKGTRVALAIADEPGVDSQEAVEKTKTALKSLRASGYDTYLTTHARMHDSFHQLAPWLSINTLHAEDVTRGAASFAESAGGRLWLYNGGSFNVAAPKGDRFFFGLYSWLAGASGVIQWIYTRPGDLGDALDLRTRLSQDAQFYALPGKEGGVAATPGLLGLSAGIVDRSILDAAVVRARRDAEVARILGELRTEFPLPERFDETSGYRLRLAAQLDSIRERLLRAMAQ